MTPVGRDWPKGYERGLDNAAISAILRIQKAGRAVHLGNVRQDILTAGRHPGPRAMSQQNAAVTGSIPRRISINGGVDQWL